MKILYYTHPCFLDCDLPLIKAFREQGHDVYLFFELCSYQLQSTIVDIKKQLPEVELLPMLRYDELQNLALFVDPEKTFVLNRPCKIWNYKSLKLRRRFLKAIKAINPDVIHCTNFIDVSELFLYTYRKRLVQVVHDPFPHSGEGSIRKRVNRWVSYKLIKSFVLLNEQQKEQFIEVNRVASHYVHSNRLGTYDYLTLFRKERAKKEKIVLFWGRISPYKGVEYLLSAMNRVHRCVPDAKLIVAGGGSLYFDFTPYKEKSYIKLINRYISMVELGELLSKATVVVCPYTDATQSGVVMSAFTFQVPVIATNVGGLPKMIDDGTTGLIVDRKDADALADGIIKLLQSEDLLKSMSDNIFHLCHDGKLSWNEIALGYLEIYQKQLNG